MLSRLRVPSGILIAAFLFSLSTPAFSATEASACGTTAAAAVVAAEKALASGSKDAQAAALTCVVAALKTMQSVFIAPLAPKGSPPPK